MVWSLGVYSRLFLEHGGRLAAGYLTPPGQSVVFGSSTGGEAQEQGTGPTREQYTGGIEGKRQREGRGKGGTSCDGEMCSGVLNSKVSTQSTCTPSLIFESAPATGCVMALFASTERCHIGAGRLSWLYSDSSLHRQLLRTIVHAGGGDG